MAFIRTHISCEHCGSSDGASLNDDHSTYCFVCSTHTPATETTIVIKDIMQNKIKEEIDLSFVKAFNNGNSVSVSERRITKSTMEKYGVVRESNNLYFPYYDKDSQLIAAKVRPVSEKKFSTAGDWTKGTLFGQNLFPSGGKYITITEGEFDALAAFQMTGSKWPVVSVRNGAGSALKDCKAQYEYLDSFENIVICFDGDEPGRKAAREVAEVFGAKCKVFKPDAAHKDACDWLSESKESQFVSRWWASENFTPDGLINGNSLWDMVSEPVAKADCLYPWEGLNKLSGGIRKGELVTITAGSGLGKSQILREIMFHVLKNTEDNLGLMFMEESLKRTALSMMSLASDTPLHLPDTVISDDERRKAFDETMGSNRLYFFQHFGSSAIENIVNRVRYMAKGLGCKYIALDHLSLIVSSQENGDERKAIDQVMTMLRTLVQETNISLFVISHLRRPTGTGHEDGATTSLSQLRGSGAIAQLSDIVIGAERNGQADDLSERNTSQLRVLKNRWSGETGPACRLIYNKETGRMYETFDDPNQDVL
jgi:twinkle protein